MTMPASPRADRLIMLKWIGPIEGNDSLDLFREGVAVDKVGNRASTGLNKNRTCLDVRQHGDSPVKIGGTEVPLSQVLLGLRQWADDRADEADAESAAAIQDQLEREAAEAAPKQ